MSTFPPKLILVPTDFSECANRAMVQAFALATAVGAKVHLIHAYDLYTYGMGPVMGERVLKETHAARERQLKEAVLAYKDSGALGQLLVKEGDARELIVQAAHDLKVDLILMGTVGKRGLNRMLLGSVAESVLRTAGCPVMVVR